MDKSVLNIYQRPYTREKPYECTDCGNYFRKDHSSSSSSFKKEKSSVYVCVGKPLEYNQSSHTWVTINTLTVQKAVESVASIYQRIHEENLFLQSEKAAHRIMKLHITDFI